MNEMNSFIDLNELFNFQTQLSPRDSLSDLIEFVLYARGSDKQEGARFPGLTEFPRCHEVAQLRKALEHGSVRLAAYRRLRYGVKLDLRSARLDCESRLNGNASVGFDGQVYIEIHVIP